MKLAIVLLFGITINANAGDICQKRYKEYSICEAAKVVSDQLAELLPVKIDSTATIVAAIPMKNIVNLVAKTEYTEKSFRDEIGDEKDTLLFFSETITKNLRQNICNSSPLNHDFINAGGAINYRFTYQNDKPLIFVMIDSCN